MYEQPKTSLVGRIIWLIISLLVIAGIVWLILWFFFWRGPSAKTTGTSTKNTQSAGQSNGTKTSGQSSSGTSSTNTPSGSSTTTPSSLGQVVEETSGVASSTPAATTLANTGPGDLVTPVVITVAGGVIFYQVRLRRRYVTEVK